MLALGEVTMAWARAVVQPSTVARPTKRRGAGGYDTDEL
jgi:hypothetical protein